MPLLKTLAVCLFVVCGNLSAEEVEDSDRSTSAPPRRGAITAIPVGGGDAADRLYQPNQPNARIYQPEMVMPEAGISQPKVQFEKPTYTPMERPRPFMEFQNNILPQQLPPQNVLIRPPQPIRTDRPRIYMTPPRPDRSDRPTVQWYAPVPQRTDTPLLDPLVLQDETARFARPDTPKIDPRGVYTQIQTPLPPTQPSLPRLDRALPMTSPSQDRQSEKNAVREMEVINRSDQAEMKHWQNAPPLPKDDAVSDIFAPQRQKYDDRLPQTDPRYNQPLSILDSPYKPSLPAAAPPLLEVLSKPTYPGAPSGQVTPETQMRVNRMLEKE